MTLYAIAMLGGTHVIALCFLMLIFTPLWPIVVLYVGWVILFEWNTPCRGGRPQKEFIKNLPVFSFIRDYYPITLEKTSDLDPKKNYIFGYHPHGCIAVGAVMWVFKLIHLDSAVNILA